MNFPDKESVERIRREYPAGCRIVLDGMEDPYTKIPIGTQGTVKGVDDTASVMPAWDCGSNLSVVYGVDSYHKIRTEEEALKTINWYGKHQPEENARCPRCGEMMMGSKNRHALSRYADIIVCDQCGMIESLEKAGLMEALPLMKWCCIETSQNGDGAWRG
jgi:ribosomal protein S27AE